MIANFNDHAANERTFLAWVRTAFGMVGFGLAIDRLGGDPAPPWVAVALLVSGLAVIGIAYLRMARLRTRIDTPNTEEDMAEGGDILLGALITGLFVMMVLFAVHVW